MSDIRIGELIEFVEPFFDQFLGQRYKITAISKDDEATYYHFNYFENGREKYFPALLKEIKRVGNILNA